MSCNTVHLRILLNSKVYPYIGHHLICGPLKFVFVGHLISLLRGLVVRVMGKNGHPHAVEEARKRFKAHCSGGEQIHADLRAPVYVTVLANGDEQTFEEMLKVRWYLGIDLRITVVVSCLPACTVCGALLVLLLVLACHNQSA